MCVSLSLSFCPSVFQSLCVSVCVSLCFPLCVCISNCFSVSPSFCVSVSPFLPVCVCVCVSVPLLSLSLCLLRHGLIFLVSDFQPTIPGISFWLWPILISTILKTRRSLPNIFRTGSLLVRTESAHLYPITLSYVLMFLECHTLAMLFLLLKTMHHPFSKKPSSTCLKLCGYLSTSYILVNWLLN